MKEPVAVYGVSLTRTAISMLNMMYKATKLKEVIFDDILPAMVKGPVCLYTNPSGSGSIKLPIQQFHQFS